MKKKEIDLTHLGVMNTKTANPNNVVQDDYIMPYITLKKGYDEQNNQLLIHRTEGYSYLKTKVTHNGKIHGDAGHGGKVEIEFESDYIWNYQDPGTISLSRVSDNSFKVTLLGESERKQFVQALKEIVKELE